MSLLDNVKSMLEQYSVRAGPAGDAGAHFQQVAQSVDSGTVAQGIAAMQSEETPPFAQIVSQLFASGSDDQKAAMLNALLSSVEPNQRHQLAALVPGLGIAPSVRGASPVSPTAIQTLAQHAEQHDSGIIDKTSTLCAAHPMLMKTLGSGAMMIAIRRIAQRHGQKLNIPSR